MVAEELKQLTSRAIAFHQPDVSESCDRPQLPNRFNIRNIIRPRDRILVAIAPLFVKLPWKLQLLR
ncbi:hypothetical protein [Oscillatoria nigro-viridis]|uniref:hypothetical protein n=1 Tax=Phormidium nigroviride TaxID=482564 RepID=UPI0002E6423D|nr:hypothetical protein [Oscillatoria nigro-viridis]